MSADDSRVLEIRTYALRPGTRGEYHRIFQERALPLLRAYGIRVVRAGPCLEDENSYVLIRGFRSLAERDEQEERFYDSDDWRDELREEVLGRIESYLTVVVPVSAAAVEALAGAPG